MKKLKKSYCALYKVNLYNTESKNNNSNPCGSKSNHDSSTCGSKTNSASNGCGSKTNNPC